MIPLELGTLTQLEVLELNKNRLTGKARVVSSMLVR